MNVLDLKRFSQSELLRNVLATYFVRILLIAVGLINTVVVARSLGPEGRGFFATASAIAALGVQFGNLGVQASNTYSVSKDRTLLPHLLGNSLWISFGLGGIIALVCWIISGVFPGAMPIHGPLLALSLIWIPFGLAYTFMQSILLGVGEVRVYNVTELVSRTLGVVLIAALFFVWTPKVEVVFSFGLFALILALIMSLRCLSNHTQAIPGFSKDLFLSTLNYGLKAYFANLFAFLVLRIDLLMVQYQLGPEQTGFYSIGVTMADMFAMLPSVIGTILFPKLAELKDSSQKWRLTKKCIALTAGSMLLLIIPAILLAEPVIRLLLGAAFLPSAIPFFYLLPGVFFLGLEVIAAQFLASQGFPRSVIYAWAAVLLSNVALNWWLLPILGINGAAIISSLSYFLILALVLLIVRKELK